MLRADDVAGDVEQILSTSPNFNPTFPLADSIESLARRIRDNQIHDGAREGHEAAHAVN